MIITSISNVFEEIPEEARKSEKEKQNVPKRRNDGNDWLTRTTADNCVKFS